MWSCCSEPASKGYQSVTVCFEDIVMSLQLPSVEVPPAMQLVNDAGHCAGTAPARNRHVILINTAALHAGFVNKARSAVARAFNQP
jgi:hypothetical protein